MRPIDFPQSNFTYAKDQPEYQPLPVHHKQDENGTVISCWQLTDEEIERIKESKQIFLSVLTFNHPLQPLYMTTDIEDVLVQNNEQDGEETT